MGKDLICIEHLSKSFKENTIFENIHLKIEEGEIVALVGPSGVGKSTLLRVIAGLEDPTKGDILINNKSFKFIPANKRPITMMFQQPLLFPHMTVLQNIVYSLSFQKVKKKEMIEKGREYLRLMQLTDYENRYPHELSGGQQQRVSLARAIITNPKLLLLDEPFSSLDNELRVKVREWVRQLLKDKGITAIFVTHDIEEAMVMGDRIAIFNHKRIQQIGKSMQIYENPQNSYVAQFYCDGILLNEREFVFSNRLVIGESVDTFYKCWKANVKSQFKKHGHTFFKLYLPTIHEQVVLRLDKNLSIGQEVFVGIHNPSDIYSFPVGDTK